MSKNEEAVTKAELKEVLKDAVDAILPAAVAAAQAANQIPQRAAAPTVGPVGRCGDCGQNTKACQGKHRKAVVYLHNAPDLMPYWRGVGCNGVWYRSDDAGRAITIPEGLDAEAQAAAWGKMEMENRLGRTRSAGSIGAHMADQMHLRMG